MLLGATAACSVYDESLLGARDASAGAGGTDASTPAAGASGGGAAGDGGAGSAGACPEPALYYRDSDGDGYGADGESVESCSQPDGYANRPGDCDDDVPSVNPEGVEICNSLDDDCANGPDDSGVCPEGCVGAYAFGKSYMFCGGKASWFVAKARCQESGMSLARVDSVEEDVWLMQFFTSLSTDTTAWIGGSDAEEGKWVWMDGEQFWQGDGKGTRVNDLYTRWEGANPDNYGGSENCLEFKRNGYWNDFHCTAVLPFICQK